MLKYDPYLLSIGGIRDSDCSDVTYGIAVGDESSDLTVGASKVTFRAPYTMNLTEVRCSVNEASVGADIVVDINKNGVSILSTKLSIDAGEKTSVTATVPAVFSDIAIVDDDEITVDIDQVGPTSAGTGLKLLFKGTKV